MRVVISCVDEIPQLFDAVANKDTTKIEELKNSIFKKEEEADNIKNELRQHLPRTTFLPVSRRDLLDILDMQDSIADVAQDIAGLLFERSMQVPQPLTRLLMPFVNKCVEVCHYSGKIIEELDELLEMGFGGREASTVDSMVDKLNCLEDDSDNLGIELARVLFKHEDELKPVSVVFWYRLIDWVGDLADYAEKVGNRLRLLIAQ